MSVRGPQDWKVGDLAWVATKHSAHLSFGDIIHVTQVRRTENRIGYGSCEGLDSRSALRILAPEELVRLPQGAVVVRVRRAGGEEVGSEHAVGTTTGVTFHSGLGPDHQLKYALKSLPDPKRDEAMKRIEAAERELEEAKRMLE